MIVTYSVGWELLLWKDSRFYCQKYKTKDKKEQPGNQCRFFFEAEAKDISNMVAIIRNEFLRES